MYKPSGDNSYVTAFMEQLELFPQLKPDGDVPSEQQKEIERKREEFGKKVAAEAEKSDISLEEYVQTYATEEGISRENLQQQYPEATNREVAEIYESEGLSGKAMDASLHQLTKKTLESEKLENLATKDPLTGLANRRALMESIKKMQSQIKRAKYFESAESNPPYYSLLLIDIDHFKRVNDTLGHTVGDAALREVARAIETCVRPEDLVARWGGEEFVVVVTGDMGTALAVAERIRRRVEETKIRKDGVFADRTSPQSDSEADPSGTFNATLSIGVAPYGEDFEKQIGIADAGLYVAKGKNDTAQESLRKQWGLNVEIPEMSGDRNRVIFLDAENNRLIRYVPDAWESPAETKAQREELAKEDAAA